MKKKTVLLGLGIALVFLVFMTNGVNAQENPKGELCRQVMVATTVEMGAPADFVYDLGGKSAGTWVVTGLSGRPQFMGTVHCDKSPKDFPRWLNASDTFHGHKAIWIIHRDNTTGSGSVQLDWLVGPYVFLVGQSYNPTWTTLKTFDSAMNGVLETAEIMYKYIEEFGLIESSHPTAVVCMTKVYSSEGKKTYRKCTTIDLVKGMSFEALDPDKSIISFPNKVIYRWSEIDITDIVVEEETFKLRYTVRSKGESVSYTINNLVDRPVESYIQAPPRDIAFLMDVYGYEESIVVTRTRLYTTIILKEAAESAVIFIASTLTPLAIPAYIYDKYDTAGEALKAIRHYMCRYGKSSPQAADYYIGPRNTKGAIVMPSGKILHNSQGLIGMTNNRTEVYVFEGEFQLSDLDETKTVTIHANQSSTCELGSVPSDPKQFDKSSVDEWWETINKSISFDDSQTEDKPISSDDSQTGNWTDDDSGCWETSNGIHTMTGTSESIIAQCLYHNQELCDFTFEADIQKTSGDKPGPCTYGLYFRGDGTKENCYFFTITATGLYLISKKVEGEYITMLGATPSDSLKTGYNEWNTLTVIARGSTTEFFINDDLVASMGDESFSCGKVGLYAIDSSTSNTPDIVQFRNIQITELEGVTPTPTPTPNPNLIPPQSGFPILP